MSSAPKKRKTRPHLEFILASLGGVAVGGLTHLVDKNLSFVAGTSAFFAIFLLGQARQLKRLTASYLSQNARKADEPVFVIFLVTLVVAAAAFTSLFLLLSEQGAPNPIELGISLLSVLLGWCTIQATFAIHYAHLCWLDHEATEQRGEPVARKSAEGLDFPGDDEPGGWDFLYFSITIGMTAQTADVDTTSTRLRKAVSIHAIISFFFNAVIVAAAVNIAVNLGQ
ncbi:DUF1345 domain-containing protein [Mesorhizobium sp. RP14(2022)]|uniref:DUF1345 domain-containing protein n=1 Tax=Mesorhizobium liriopis TaxID=2953882 RepID=A0ABT1CBB3_9HYPH|nr:DUF1345 domain-containing protein [Mesorhizobium liriopis]